MTESDRERQREQDRERWVTELLADLARGSVTLPYLKTILARGRRKAKERGYIEGSVIVNRLNAIGRAIELAEKQRNE
jgi:hypothetical protein